MTTDLGEDIDPPATHAAHCDSCGDKTATGPECDDCRAATFDDIATRAANGRWRAPSDVLWLVAEVGRLRDTLTRRGEEYDAARAALDIEYGTSTHLAAQLAGANGRVAETQAHLDEVRALFAPLTFAEAAAERDQLAGQMQRVQALTYTSGGIPLHDTKRLTVAEIRAALDGGQP